MNMIDWLNKDW